MTQRSSFAGKIRLIVVLAALAALAPEQSLGQIQSVTVSKGDHYQQTSATTVVLESAGNNFSFNADVNGINIQSITPPVLSGPVNTAQLGTFWNGGQLLYSNGDQGWRLGFPGANDWASPTLADLNAKFANGTYTFLVNGNSIPLQLAGDAYPEIPVMTLQGGSWAGGKYVFDPARPLVITTNVFTGYGTHADDGICIGAFVPGFTTPFQEVAPYGCHWLQARQFASSVPGMKTLTYTVPANTFTAGQESLVGAFFIAVVDRRPVAALPGSENVAYYARSTVAAIKAQAPIFPLTVNANIGPTVSNATATFVPRPQDAGKNAYVFAVAPASVVKNAVAETGAHLGMTAKGAEKDVAVQCVIAQLNASGQLQAVSTSSLQAYLTAVIAGQSQAVTLLNNVPTTNIAGATFYLGLAPDPAGAVNSGVNQRALTVPGSPRCDPEAPQTGWWWNPNEGGRGYSIEVSDGGNLVFASYLYDPSGRATWLLASGNTSLDKSVFPTGRLESYAQGQTLSGTYKAPAGVVGQPITLAFSDATHGTLSWPGGSIAIERFNIVPQGLTLPTPEAEPENGWWWNPAESGRGYFLEWQGGQLFMAGYMYDDAGNPIWYLSGNSAPVTNLRAYSNVWQLYGNGQTLTGTYRAPTQANANVGPVTITFQSATNGFMTLPGGRTIPIQRFAC